MTRFAVAEGWTPRQPWCFTWPMWFGIDQDGLIGVFMGTSGVCPRGATMHPDGGSEETVRFFLAQAAETLHRSLAEDIPERFEDTDIADARSFTEAVEAGDADERPANRLLVTHPRFSDDAALARARSEGVLTTLVEGLHVTTPMTALGAWKLARAVRAGCVAHADLCGFEENRQYFRFGLEPEAPTGVYLLWNDPRVPGPSGTTQEPFSVRQADAASLAALGAVHLACRFSDLPRYERAPLRWTTAAGGYVSPLAPVPGVDVGRVAASPDTAVARRVR